MLGCERRPVSASIMSRSCFASIPVCVYKFSSHYLNNVIFIDNSLGPLATESPCIYRIYKRGRGSYNGSRVGSNVQNHHPVPRPLSDAQISQYLTTITKSVTCLYLIRHYKVLHRRLRTVPIGLPANVAGATLGNWQTVDRENEGTPAKLGSWSPGKIQASIAFVWRESPCTLGRSEDFRDWKESSVQEV